MTEGLLQLLRRGVELAVGLAGRVPAMGARLEPGSWPLATVVGLGGLALLFGGLRLRRLVAPFGGALLGWGLGALAAPATSGWLPPAVPPWVGLAAVGVASAIGPDVYPVALGLAAGAIVGREVPVADRAWLGALGGAVILGLVALALRRVVLAATAAITGAAALAAVAVALSGRVEVLGMLTRRPVALAGAAAVLAVAGTAFQLGRDGRRAGARRGEGDARATVAEKPAP